MVWITNEHNEQILIQDLTTPFSGARMWLYDFNIDDFVQKPITMLERYTCAHLTMAIGTVQVRLPIDWNVLVADSTSGEIDDMTISDLSGKSFSLAVFDQQNMWYDYVQPRIIDYQPSVVFCGPVIGKSDMLCIPITERHWFLATPHDNMYKKFLCGKNIGNIVG